MLKVLSLVSVFALATPALAEPAARRLVLNPATTTTLIDTVDDSSVGAVLAGFSAMAKAKPRQVTLVIDSYGGYVSSGLRLVTGMQLLKARGISIRCVVTGAAMSMAFGILAQCDSRYALPYSALLWHPIRVRFQGVLTTDEAAKLADRLDYYEAQFKEDILASMGVDPEWFYKHWFAESVHHGQQLADATDGWITVVDGYTGMDIPQLMYIPSPNPFGFDEAHPSELIWIAPEQVLNAR